MRRVESLTQQTRRQMAITWSSLMKECEDKCPRYKRETERSGKSKWTRGSRYQSRG